MKYCLYLVALLLSLNGYCQNKIILDRISFKAGYSNSITQWGQSPFSEIRRWSRSISSVFFDLQYAQPLTKNSELAIGMQVMEKGFKRDYFLVVPNHLDQSTWYEYRLHYIELPVTYIKHFKNNALIFGLVTSYLYANDFRYREVDVIYPNNNNVKTIIDINYSTPYPNDRLNKWDFGFTLGYSRKVHKNFDLEITTQKHLINVDKFGGVDIVYNLCFLLGVRYRFLSYN